MILIVIITWLYILGPMKTEMLVELYDIDRLMRTRFDRWARTYGMTRAQGVILARLARQPGMTQNEMAGLCEVEPITVGRLVDRLEAGDFSSAASIPPTAASAACICFRPPSRSSRRSSATRKNSSAKSATGWKMPPSIWSPKPAEDENAADQRSAAARRGGGGIACRRR